MTNKEHVVAASVVGRPRLALSALPPRPVLPRPSGAMSGLDLRLCGLFACVYTLPGWAMVGLTAGVRSRFGPQKDASAVEVVRLTNRTIASTAMYIVPFLLMLRNLHVWSPWSGGVWDSPLDSTQRALLHMQLMYYVCDMPYTLLKRDVEQVVHHCIGFGLAGPTVLLGKCGLPMCAIMFTEQVRARSVRTCAARTRCETRNVRACCGSEGEAFGWQTQIRSRPRPRSRCARGRLLWLTCALSCRGRASGCATPRCSATSCPSTTRWSGLWLR